MTLNTPPSLNEPVFVVGAPRSGTTLIYHILQLSGAFPMYQAETRILVCAAHYGSLKFEANARRFAHDFLRSRQFQRSGLSPESIESGALEAGSYVGFLRHFMDALAASQAKDRWVEKTPTHVHYLERLAAEFPNARFVHVVRDGRSVAASAVELGWAPRVPGGRPTRLIWAARRWQYLVSLGSRFGLRHPRRYLQIRYEDVVERSGESLPDLIDFAGVDIDPAAIESSGHGSLGRPNSAFEAGSGAPPSDRWRTALSAREADAVTRAVAATLTRLGYGPAEAPAERMGPATLWPSALLSGLHVRGKEWAKRLPLAGRLAASPLEIVTE